MVPHHHPPGRGARPAACRGRAVVSLLAGVVVCGALASPAPAAPDAGTTPWTRPVPGAVVRPFETVAHRYAPGHRGVDLAAPAGTPVRAAGDGVVTFAGDVAGTRHVAVGHAGGLRTSYSFLASVAVRRGERVARGDVVGRAGGVGADHDGTVLHFGLRLGDDYLDPMLLFEPVELTAAVRLVAVDAAPEGRWPPATQEAHGLAVGLGLAAIAPRGGDGGGDGLWSAIGGAAGAAWSAVSAVATGAVDLTTGALRAGADGLARLGADALLLAADLAERLARWSAAETPLGQVLADLAEVGRRFLAWVDARRECDASAAPADGTGGSGHRLFAVAGIDSATGADGSTLALDVEALGYHDDEVAYFSYAADGGAYNRPDTWGDLREAGRRLGEQLRALQRAEPGREVDLIAHSQGGVVVDVFLRYFYDPADPTLPPLGTVVTLSSPHEGAPIATAVTDVRATRTGRLAVDELGEVLPGPDPAAASIAQLAEDSRFLGELWARPAHEQIEVTTIGATADVVVPATNVSVPGAQEITVGVDGVNDHSGVLGDPAALRAVRAALERKPLPCVGLRDGIEAAVLPVAVRRLERSVGDVGAGLADLAWGPVAP